MVHCAECKVKFSKTSNLRAHVRRKHPEKIDILAPKVKGQHGTYICQECKGTFVNFGNLRVHAQQKHPGKLEELAPIKKKKFNCKQCNTEFDMLKQLVVHKRTHQAESKVLIKCPLCQYTGAFSKDLISHYRIEHLLAIDSETLEFETFEAFQEWKMHTEKQTFSSFVNMHGLKQGVNCKRIKYTCHRSGVTRKVGNNIRSFKAQGSNKINAYCPAEMNVIIDETKCVVQFCKTHIGHKLEQEMGNLFLSTSDRQNIAFKIAAKIPKQTILDEVRDSVSKCHLERVHLLTRKDLYNIEKAFHLNESAERRAKITKKKNYLLYKDDLTNDMNEVNEVEETTNHVMAVSTNEPKPQDLFEEQQKLVQTLQQHIFSTQTLEEIEAIEKICAPIQPTLEAIRNNQGSALFSTSISHNKKIEPLKGLFKTKKTIKKEKVL